VLGLAVELAEFWPQACAHIPHDLRSLLQMAGVET